MTISLTLPYPDRDLNPNSRIHWATKARVTKAARHEAGWAVRRLLKAKPDWQRASVSLTFCPPDERRRDLQNCIGSAKALIDGIADALGIDDSRFDVRYAFGPVTKGGAVVVTIAQLETARTFEEMEPVLFAGMRTPKVGT
jgi:crossover junction endodeoxyribonuclease RusA